MSRNIFLTLMVAIFPFALKAQETKATEYPFMGYTLGKDETHLQLREIAIAAGTSCQVNLTGFADGNPYKTNSRTQNQDLSERRASNAAKILNELGIDFGRIHAKGIAVPQRGPQYRGVKISLDCPVVSAPMQKNDSLAHVAKRVDTLETAVAAVEKKVEKLDTAVTQVTQVVQQIINADTGKKEKGISFEFAPSYSASDNNIFTLGTAITADLKNTSTRLVAQGGLFPAGKDKKLECSKGHVSAALGLERDIKGGPFGVSIGAFTDRTFCYNGGPDVAETLTYRREGGYLGGSFKPKWEISRKPVFSIQATYGPSTTLENPKPKNRFGLRTGLRIPLFSEKMNDSTNTNR